MQLTRSVGGISKGTMTQIGARAIGRGMMMQQWSRQVYLKMASTALIISALQPVRPALHLPVKQQVGPGRVARGNYSSFLLLRQCASTDLSGTVLLETRDCADGSIMYKFGSPDQRYSAGAVVDPNFLEDAGGGGGDGQCPAQLSSEGSDPTDASEGPREPDLKPVVVVNGVQHPHSRSTSPAAPSAKEEGTESLSDVTQKLAGLGLGGPPVDSGSVNGFAPPAGAPVKDVGSPESQDISSEVKKDGTGKEEKVAYFNSGAAMIPHPEKAARGGEDAFFIEGNRWIGVADGVGGWANEGINAGLYARELMWNCAELARQAEKDSDPKTVLVKSFSKTKALGSTTAVIASITNQTLNVANMGDSGFLVIRDGILLDGSAPMLRGFNFPYQIGSEGDDPLLAEVYRVSVKEGDVVVLASDGLFDNLFHDEIVDIVNSVVQAGSGPEVVAKKLASEAHKAGGTNTGLTPFAKEAQRVGYSYMGGKMDDITAVVSFIS